ncbi:GAP6 Amino-acid permease GAP6 [Candida maltosa Xu316]
MSDKKSLDIPMKDISPESLTTTKTSSIDEEEKEPSVWRNFADSFKPPVRHPSDLEDRPSQFESEVVPVMEQGLKKRQLQMMALSGCVGSGLLVASGIALKNGGPAALLLAWAIVSTFLYCTMQSLAELSSMYKASGSFAAFSIRFIDPSWGTAMGLNYALFWIIVNPLELVASSMTISFWPSHINTVVWVAVFYVLIFGLNLFGGVRGFGETEFIAGIIKLLGVVGFNILAIILICGGGDQGYIGGKNWHPAFTTAKGTISCLLTATYSLAGTELVGLTSGEIKESRKVLPKAIKQVVWRIIIFYLLTLTLIGFLVPASSDELLGGGGGASASPFVIAIRQGGIKVLPSIFNVVVLVALLAIANSAVYGYSRTMFGLAEEGVVPKIFKYVDRKGRPLFGIATAAIIGLLGFVSASKHQDEVFAWLVALSGLSTLFTWGSINGAYIRFRGAMAAQGRSLDEIPYKSNTGVWGAYYGLIMNIAVLGLQFWLALFPLGGKPKAKDFFQTYLAAVIVLALYIIHKVWTKNWRWVVPYEEIDLDLGRTDVDMDTLKQEIIEEKERLSAKPWYYRWYQFWC